MKFNNYFLKISGSILSFIALALLIALPVSSAANDSPENTELAEFTDVNAVHTNIKAIDYLHKNKIVVGYQDGTFQPKNGITRAEFLKITMEASNHEIQNGKSSYSDVPMEEWYGPYIYSATKAGLVSGYADGTFKPNDKINFAEASKIMANAFGIQPVEISGNNWFDKYVMALEEKEVIPVSMDSFNQELTRADMAEMSWRIMTDTTYKLSNTFENLTKGVSIENKMDLENFKSCKELHDFFRDNSNETYFSYRDNIDQYIAENKGEIPKDLVWVAPSFAEKGGCFTGETQISMADGTHKSIKDISMGDLILTRKNSESADLVPAKVKNTVKHHVAGYLVINDDLEVTPEHIVYVNDAWDVARNIKEGDYLTDDNGKKIEVYSVRAVEKPAWVYNFEVEDYHTYLANGFYVHNDKGEADSFSTTNIQVQGVDEADIIKNNGKYIYYVKDNAIQVVEAYPASGAKKLDPITFDDPDFYPAEIYLDEDQLVVIGDAYVSNYFNDYKEKAVDPSYYYNDGSVKVYIFDVSNPGKIKLSREFIFEGDYNSSRKIGDTVYMSIRQSNYNWPWGDKTDWKEEDLVPLYVQDGKLDKLASCENVKYMPQALDDTSYIIMAAVPLNPKKKATAEVIIGSASDIYSSTENFYITQEKYESYHWYEESEQEEETYIHKFALDEEDIEYKGMGRVPGSILNQFSMDEYDGNFRIVTTKGNVWDEEKPSTNNLYVLGKNLDIIGKIEGLAPGERIYSARFVGDRSYVVTFKKVDPLFVIGLENAKNPKVLGKLKIPGYSDYLHPFDKNHLIGFGLEAEEATEEEETDWNQDFAWYQGVKVAMFDVTDVENPIELHKEIIGDRGTTSPLNYDHKALLYDSKAGLKGGALMAFPITVYEIPEEVKNNPDTPASTYGEPVYQGAYVYDVSVKDGFNLSGKITQYENAQPDQEKGYGWYGENDIERIIYIGDHFYTLSQAAITANAMIDGLPEVAKIQWENAKDENN